MGFNSGFKGLINANLQLQREVKNRAEWESPLRRRGFALDCSAIKGEEEGEDYIKNYKILSENKFARHMF